MKMILDVVNASSGRNTATADKFPNRVLTGTFDAGFSSTQLNKDLGLYRDAADAVGASRPVGPAVFAVWRHLEAQEPNAGHLAHLRLRARHAQPSLTSATARPTIKATPPSNRHVGRDPRGLRCLP